MQTLRSLFFAFVAILFSLPGAAHAADVAFFPVEGGTLKPEDAIAIGDLLSQSYASVSGQAVLAPSRTQVVASNYPEAASQLGVAEYVRTDAVALGQRIVIHATRYQANGTALFQARMTAERIEDMIAVSDRMAKALFFRVDEAEVRTRHNVTLAEGRPEARRWTEKLSGVKVGLHMPLAKDAKYAPAVSGMFDMRLESDRFFIEFGAGLMLSSDVGEEETCSPDSYGGYSCKPASGKSADLSALQAEVGASYFLTEGNVAPYVGGGFIPRIVFSDEVVGLAPYLQLGVTLPRDSSTRFYVDGRVAQNVLAMSTNAGTKVYPTELSLQVGVGW